MRNGGIILVAVMIIASAMFSAACGGNKPETTGTPSSLTPSATPTPAVSTSKPTASVAPVIAVTTADATSISSTSAKLSANIAVAGADQRGFDWGTSPGEYPYSWAESGSFGGGAYSQVVTGLTQGTTYYFRGKAHNSSGWGYGGEKTFKTLTPAKITSVNPEIEERRQTVNVIITGTDLSGTAAVSFGDSITINNYDITSDTQITASITIAADAAIGVRTISVTTPAGVSTLDDGFKVKEKSHVLKTIVWSDSEFNAISHALTAGVQYTYQLHFVKNNKMQVTAMASFTFGVTVEDGRLCFTDVPLIAWQDVYYSAREHLSYDNFTMKMYVNSLPAELLKKEFGDDVESLPVIESATTGDGEITLTYYTQ